MAFQLSPGVNVSEIDLTTVVPSVATSVGAFAGSFAWGPVDEIVTVSDEVRFVERFGKPDSSNYEYWFSAANFLAYANNLKVVRAFNATSTLNATANGGGVLIKNYDDFLDNYSTGDSTRGIVVAKYPGSIGNTLRVSICSSAAAYSSNLTLEGIKSNIIIAAQTVIGVSGTANVSQNVQVGDLISFNGGNTYTRVANVNTVAITVSTSPGAVTEGTAILRKWQYADNFGVAPGTSSYATAAGGANDEIHIIVVDEDGKLSNGVANTILEKFSFLSKASDAKNDDGSSNYYVNVLNDRSRYVWWQSHPTGASTAWGNTAAAGANFESGNPATRNPTYASLTSGADGSIGSSELITAYNKFANPDAVDISLVVSGPGNATLAASLISMAETRKDCLIFLSPPKSNVVDSAGSESTKVISYRDGLSSTSYAVMDSGYKYQFDKYNDVYRWVPLNADIAGTCARTDLERDPWFSPGGFNRGVIKNVVKLSWNPTKAERDNLYVKGINPIVSFPGEGTVLFGDKTMLSRPSVFDRINTRRLFIVLEKAIARAARASMFEFNDQFTRAQFVNLVEPYLRDIQGRRGITDFRVVCDETNNTGQVIDRNEFVGDIYIKPARSINFIQLNFVAVRTGVTFEEVVGRF